MELRITYSSYILEFGLNYCDLHCSSMESVVGRITLPYYERWTRLHRSGLLNINMTFSALDTQVRDRILLDSLLMHRERICHEVTGVRLVLFTNGGVEAQHPTFLFFRPSYSLTLSEAISIAQQIRKSTHSSEKINCENVSLQQALYH